MKKLLIPLVLIFVQYFANAQCTCSLHVSTIKQNAVANCHNGSITATITGDLCGSLTLATIRLRDSVTLTLIETQLVSEVPGFVYFANVPAGSYKIVVSHPCAPSATAFQHVPSVLPDVAFTKASIDVSVYGCNDGAIGLEITNDFCPATLNITCQDTLPPYTTVNFTQTPYCSFCYLAPNLRAGVYKIDVSDINYPQHYIQYVTINEPACTFYITANQGRLEACVKENIVIHLLGDYCLSNTFSVRLYNSNMVLKDSIINEVFSDTLMHFINLNPDTYTVTATYAGNCTSTTTAVITKYCPAPLNLSDVSHGCGSRMLTWSDYPCVTGYELAYKRKGTTVWQIITLSGANSTSVTLNGLIAGATYQWKVRSKCSATKKSAYTAVRSFTVHSGARLLSALDEQSIMIKPNPAEDIFTVTVTTPFNKLTESIYTDSGELVFCRKQCSADESYNLAPYPKGVYLLKVEDGSSAVIKRIVHL